MTNKIQITNFKKQIINKIQITSKVQTNSPEFEKEGLELYDEAIQLKKIFSSIIEKSK